MFGSEVLEVALGLVLVFLLMSLVLTAVQEAIEAVLRSRSGDLNRAIHELLQQDKKLLEELYNHPLIFALHRGGIGSQASLRALGASGWNPFGKARRDARAARKTLPSYVPRETFAAALIDMLQTGAVTNPDLLRSLGALDRLAGGNLARVRSEIEGWYDGAMDRASGWFKRRTQKTLFALGLAAALLLNINAVVVARYLATDQDARAYAARRAEAVLARGAPGTADINQLHQELQESVGLPIGWSDASIDQLRRVYPKETSGFSPAGMLAGLVLLIGYLIPAFAAMLGAPFWFDVLNRIMVIRSTVKPKEKSPDEPSEEGGGKPGGGAAGGGTPPGPPGGTPGAGGTPVGGAALLTLPGASAGAPGASGADEEEKDLDGCLEDYDVSEEEATDDVELPPASGGVEEPTQARGRRS